MHGEVLQVDEWKCMYAPKPKVMQTCNLFDCPKWVAMEWSQVRPENVPLPVKFQILMMICHVLLILFHARSKKTFGKLHTPSQIFRLTSQIFLSQV